MQRITAEGVVDSSRSLETVAVVPQGCSVNPVLRYNQVHHIQSISPGCTSCSPQDVVAVLHCLALRRVH